MGPAEVTSYWQRGWRDQWQHGSLPPSVDFAVLGGGLAGLTTAIRLRELHPAADVVLLEAERVGYGASGRNAGFLSPLAAPVWLLGRSPDHAWAAARINADVHEVAGWIGQHVAGAELEAATLSLQATGAISNIGLAEFADALAHTGLPHRLARPRHLVLEMDAYTVHPYLLVRGLAEHAARIGVRIRERARVRSIDGARVILDGTSLRAHRIIVCTNAYTGALDVGERLRALVIHSFMLATEPMAGLRSGTFTVELNSDQAFHRVHAGRVIYGAGDKLRAGDPPSSMQRQLEASYPGARVAEQWAGKFHATANGLPIIRRARKNTILNVGYGGTGVALTLACARLAAAVASDRFASSDDERLHATMGATRISVRDALRAVGRMIVRR